MSQWVGVTRESESLFLQCNAMLWEPSHDHLRVSSLVRHNWKGRKGISWHERILSLSPKLLTRTCGGEKRELRVWLTGNTTDTEKSEWSKSVSNRIKVLPSLLGVFANIEGEGRKRKTRRVLCSPVDTLMHLGGVKGKHDTSDSLIQTLVKRRAYLNIVT